MHACGMDVSCFAHTHTYELFSLHIIQNVLTTRLNANTCGGQKKSKETLFDTAEALI